MSNERLQNAMNLLNQAISGLITDVEERGETLIKGIDELNEAVVRLVANKADGVPGDGNGSMETTNTTE